MDFLRSDGSGVNREVRAPFCEGLRGKLPWSTHPRTRQATVLVTHGSSVIKGGVEPQSARVKLLSLVIVVEVAGGLE